MNLLVILQNIWARLWGNGTPNKDGDLIYCDPAVCDECVYVGEGGFLCGVTHNIVVDDFTPTEHYMGKGCPNNKYGAYYPAMPDEEADPSFMFTNVFKLDDGTPVYSQRWFDMTEKASDGTLGEWVTFFAYLEQDQSLTCFYAVGDEEISKLLTTEPDAEQEQEIRDEFGAAKKDGRI